MAKATHAWILAAVGALLFAVSSVVARHDGPAALPPVSPAAPGAPAAEPPPPDASETPRSRTATTAVAAARPETGWTPAFRTQQTGSPRPHPVIGPIITAALPYPIGIIAFTGGEDACVDGCWEDYASDAVTARVDFWRCEAGCPGADGDLRDDCVRDCRDDYRRSIRYCNRKLLSCEAECP